MDVHSRSISYFKTSSIVYSFIVRTPLLFRRIREPQLPKALLPLLLTVVSVINDGPEVIRFSVVRYDNSTQADIYVKGGGSHY
jgi:hypothetical protein